MAWMQAGCRLGARAQEEIELWGWYCLCSSSDAGLGAQWPEKGQRPPYRMQGFDRGRVLPKSVWWVHLYIRIQLH